MSRDVSGAGLRRGSLDHKPERVLRLFFVELSPTFLFSGSTNYTLSGVECKSCHSGFLLECGIQIDGMVEQGWLTSNKGVLDEHYRQLRFLTLCRTVESNYGLPSQTHWCCRWQVGPMARTCKGRALWPFCYFRIMSGDMFRLYFLEVRFLIWSFLKSEWAFLQGQPQLKRQKLGACFHAPSRQRHVWGNPGREAVQNVSCDLSLVRPSTKLCSVSKVSVSAWAIGDHGLAANKSHRSLHSSGRVVTAALKLSWLSKGFRSTQLSSGAYSSPSQDFPMFF